jgi:hypothetical protein
MALLLKFFLRVNIIILVHKWRLIKFFFIRGGVVVLIKLRLFIILNMLFLAKVVRLLEPWWDGLLIHLAFVPIKCVKEVNLNLW